MDLQDELDTLSYARRGSKTPSDMVFAWCIVGWILTLFCVGWTVFLHLGIAKLGPERVPLLMILAIVIVIESAVAAVVCPVKVLRRRDVPEDIATAKAVLLVLSSIVRCAAAICSFAILDEIVRHLW